jgi:hypothetical protein
MPCIDPWPFGVHLTNIAGTGAVQLVDSLLPALERAGGHRIDRIHLPDRGPLSHYRRVTPGPAPERYVRRLPNGLSRALECLLFARHFNAQAPLLVLGDLPLRCEGRQVVFVQTLHLAQGDRSASRVAALKYLISRAVFRLNMSRPIGFIVQSETMKDALRGRVHVVPQPAPAWLLESGMRRRGRRGARDAGLSLFYPAAPYPHKNHRLLNGLNTAGWPIERLVLTIPPAMHPAPQTTCVRCVGLLAPRDVLAAYAEADALLFLSIAESYGLPLLEAMWIGLPIVCPDLPYARTLCGDQAFYFDATDTGSLLYALQALHARLSAGWWPDWSERLSRIPPDWDAVAAAMLRVLFPSSTSAPPTPRLAATAS